MMRRHTLSFAIVALVCVLLVTGVVAVQAGGPPAAQDLVAPGAASGGGYRLTGPVWSFSGAASGGGYRLAGPMQPMLRGSGCCCTYLPCMLRKFP